MCTCGGSCGIGSTLNLPNASKGYLKASTMLRNSSGTSYHSSHASNRTRTLQPPLRLLDANQSYICWLVQGPDAVPHLSLQYQLNRPIATRLEQRKCLNKRILSLTNNNMIGLRVCMQVCACVYVCICVYRCVLHETYTHFYPSLDLSGNSLTHHSQQMNTQLNNIFQTL